MFLLYFSFSSFLLFFHSRLLGIISSILILLLPCLAVLNYSSSSPPPPYRSYSAQRHTGTLRVYLDPVHLYQGQPIYSLSLRYTSDLIHLSVLVPENSVLYRTSLIYPRFSPPSLPLSLSQFLPLRLQTDDSRQNARSPSSSARERQNHLAQSGLS